MSALKYSITVITARTEKGNGDKIFKHLKSLCPSLSNSEFCDPETVTGVTLGQWLFSTDFVFENKDDVEKQAQSLESVPEVSHVEITETGYFQ